MSTLILGSLAGTLLGWLMGFLSLFLILLVLVQRGRGGGLTGALGGPGGQSAFGSKAGDTFTLITIIVASIWGFTCAFTMWLLGTHAPTTAMPTNVTAGPGDESEDDPTKGIIIPTPKSSEAGLSGGNETPSMELTPAKPKTDTPADDPTADDSMPADKSESGKSESGNDPAPAEESPPGDNSDSAAPDSGDSDASSEDSSAEAGKE